MTDQSNPAIDAADVLALRLVMAFVNVDHQMITKALTDIRIAGEENPKIPSLVCCSLAARCARVFQIVGETIGDPNYALDHVTRGLMRAIDDA